MIHDTAFDVEPTASDKVRAATPTLRKRDIAGGVLASAVFLVAIWAALVMLP